MGDRLLQIYHSLPAPARSMAASLRGLYLRSWRYSRETERQVAEVLERESWSAERWRAWEEGQLSYVLERAATKVPYYREQWQKRRRHGDRASWAYLENWPHLSKEEVRKSPALFVAEDSPTRKMFREYTSGTSGKPLSLWWSRATVRTWYALFEARSRRWHGVTRHDRWGLLGGQLVTSVKQRRPPFWVWNAALNQLYMSSYHLSPAFTPLYLDALARYRIEYLVGYTSSLYALALEATRTRRRDLKMRIVITNAEPVYAHQREIISEAFGCSVYETYGMAEIVAAASECSAGTLHRWPEAGLVEVIERGHAVPRGSTGDLVCTGLVNADMPLIRYRVGDRGALPRHDEACPCGRTLPGMASIEGRVDDVLYTSDGRAVGRLDPVFKGGFPIREAQIIQEALDSVRVKLIPAPEFTPRAGQLLAQRLRARLGRVEVVLEEVEEIPRTTNGKFRAVICALPAEERRRLESLNARP